MRGSTSVAGDVAIEGNFFGTDATGTTKRTCRAGVFVTNDHAVDFRRSLASTLLTATATDLVSGETSEFSPCPIPPTCKAEPAGPTLRSLAYRLAAMLQQVLAAAEAGQLGPLRTRLLERVVKAGERREQAEVACRESKLGRAKGRLAKGVREVRQIRQTLRSRQARRSMDPAVREALHAAALGIRTDMGRLRGALRCPQGAAGRDARVQVPPRGLASARVPEGARTA